jgi:alpha-L-rhamnosidase
MLRHTMRAPANVPRVLLSALVLLGAMMPLKAKQPAVERIPDRDPEALFRSPPPEARPLVYWFWMGRNITKEGITGDLEALKKAGFGGGTMCNLGDQCTPWPYEFLNSINPGMDPYLSPSWWELVRHAASESRRLGLEFGMHNCPGYETSGGPWIPPELSMLSSCSSVTDVAGSGRKVVTLAKPRVDPRSDSPWPVFNADTRTTERPVIEARKSFYRDIRVLAVPAKGDVDPGDVKDLTDSLKPDGTMEWDVPEGNWKIYRIGYTTAGKLVNPTIWKSTGLECDKMNPVAVTLHIDHVLADIKSHLGDLLGSGLRYLWIDSYEYRDPLSAWTPAMLDEFRKRRGYDAVPFLPVLAGRTVESPKRTEQFKADFHRTIHDLYRDVHFAITSRKCHEAGLEFRCEPYIGPWSIPEIMPYLDGASAEFWNKEGKYGPLAVQGVVNASREAGHKVIGAEAFTAGPSSSRWNETPGGLKILGDLAFCDGINRLMLHRFTHQPWNGRYKPGMVMGQWGTHFDRTQTWWDPSGSWVDYLRRCQALLQWGAPSTNGMAAVPKDLHTVGRTDGTTQLFFVANSSTNRISTNCVFGVRGMIPELWNPVDGSIRSLPDFSGQTGGTDVRLEFEPAQSYFIVFRKPAAGADKSRASLPNFPSTVPVMTIAGPWQVRFDPAWGGPSDPACFTRLEDWTKNTDPGIRFYSGTATYSTSFDMPSVPATGLRLDLGRVNHLARVLLNEKDLGTLWTAPWQVTIPAGLLKPTSNALTIEVTNVWANRLIGDEQEPDDCEWMPSPMWGGKVLSRIPDWVLQGKDRPSKGRRCFTTWNYFTKNSPLVPSGLLGPVSLVSENPDGCSQSGKPR